MSIEFWQTRMGHKFYQADVPRIAKALERIADALERGAVMPSDAQDDSSQERCECDCHIDDRPGKDYGKGHAARRVVALTGMPCGCECHGGNE
ncbi:MAG: hypothetical protein JSV86_16885 [Gemmatimonadota bacterium]|nr:MAG: hypothetical protein JSV86_16885 [Gemmatimonadota bacterium]